MGVPEPLVFHQRLGGHLYRTSLVLISCNQGSVIVNGNHVPGRLRYAGEGFGASSAFLSLAEVWTATDKSS